MTAGGPQAGSAPTRPARPRDYVLLLPPGWVRIPAGERAAPAVTRLVNARFHDLPGDRRDLARRQLRRDILAMVGRAAAAGAIEVHLLVDPIRGAPVSAACVTTYIPAPGPGIDVAIERLLPELADPETSTTLTTAAGAHAVRRLSRDPGRQSTNLGADPAAVDAAITALPDDPEALDRLQNDLTADDAAVPPSTHVDYVVPVPGSDGAHLVLAFSTATQEIADQMVVLFDAMAGSLRWVW